MNHSDSRITTMSFLLLLLMLCQHFDYKHAFFSWLNNWAGKKSFHAVNWFTSPHLSGDFFFFFLWNQIYKMLDFANMGLSQWYSVRERNLGVEGELLRKWSEFIVFTHFLAALREERDTVVGLLVLCVGGDRLTAALESNYAVISIRSMFCFVLGNIGWLVTCLNLYK